MELEAFYKIMRFCAFYLIYSFYFFLELPWYLKILSIIFIVGGVIFFLKKYKQGKILDFNTKLKPFKFKKAKSFRIYEEKSSIMGSLFFYFSHPNNLSYLPKDISKYIQKERRKGSSYLLILLKFIFSFLKFIFWIALIIIFFIVFFYLIAKITIYVMMRQ